MIAVQIENLFEPSHGGTFMQRSGVARKPGAKPAERKLHFASADQVLLREILLDLVRRPDCFFVKYSVEPQDGMYLGRCFMMDDATVEELWKSFQSHPKLTCTIEDDDFALQLR